MSTPVFVSDPPGILAAGKGSAWFVPAIADITAPTVAEIQAGVNISCELFELNVGFDQTSVGRVKYCSKEEVQSPGKTTRTIDRIRYEYDPQDPESTDYAAYAELTPGTRGFLVDRRGLDAREVDVAADQYVHITPIELGARDDRPINPTEEGGTLQVEQIIHVVGEKQRDIKVVA